MTNEQIDEEYGLEERDSHLTPESEARLDNATQVLETMYRGLKANNDFMVRAEKSFKPIDIPLCQGLVCPVVVKDQAAKDSGAIGRA